jgi:aspartate racemase
MADERLLGIVGGVGPESTIDYYRSIITEYRRRKPDGSYPRLLINNLDAGAVFKHMVVNDAEGVAACLTPAIRQLAAGGAQAALIASVTTHMGYAIAARAAPIPMLSILDALCAAAVTRGIQRPALFATRMTTEGRFFAEPFERAGIELIRPDEPDRAWINEMYFGELVHGEFRDESRARLIAIAGALLEQHGIDAIILGGTELPLILREPAVAGIPVLDPTRVHVAAAVDWLLSDA